MMHLMRFVDRPQGAAPLYRFSSHRTFRYWCLMARLRNQVRTQCRAFLQQNENIAYLDPSDVDEGTIRQFMRITQRCCTWVAFKGRVDIG